MKNVLSLLSQVEMLDVIFALMILILPACSTLYSVGPVAIVETPEIYHEEPGHRSIFVKTEPASRFTLSDCASCRPLRTNTTPDLQNSVLINVGANFDLSRDFQLGFAGDGLGALNGEYLLRGMAKFKIFGPSYNQAKGGDFSMAVFAHPILGHLSVSGDQDGFWGPGGYPWSANSSYSGINGGLSTGYLLSDRSFIYAGIAMLRFQVSGSIHQSESKTGDYPAMDVSFPNTEGNSKSLQLGWRFGIRYHVIFNASYSETQWGDLTNKVTMMTFGVNWLDFTKPGPPLLPVQIGR